MMSRQDSASSPVVKTGRVMPMMVLSDASSSTRKMNASDRPMMRALRDRTLSSRAVSNAMNTRLSMPSTTSSAVSVSSAAQALASVRRSSIRSSLADDAGEEEISAKGGGDIRPRLEILCQRQRSQRAPGNDEHDVEPTQALDPQWVHKAHRHECQSNERGQRRGCDPLRRLQHVQIKCGQVPH